MKTIIRTRLTSSPILARPSLLLAAGLAVTAAAHGAQRPRFANLDSDLTPGDGTGYLTALADLDGDADLDMLRVAASPFPGHATLLRNGGDGSFVQSTTPLPALSSASSFYTSRVLSVDLGDVDGDGDVDVFFGTDATGGNGFPDELWLNDGVGNFSDASHQLPPQRTRTGKVVLADVDGDGDLDAIGGHAFPGSFGSFGHHLWINDGAGFFVDASHQLPNSGSTGLSMAVTSIGAADVDGDGDTDLLFGGFGVGGTTGGCTPPAAVQSQLYLNDGFGMFSGATAQLPQDARVTRWLQMGDVDGDGDMDAVLASLERQLGTMRDDQLWLNDGTGHFVDASQRLPADQVGTRSISLADFDMDGDLDIARGPDAGGQCRAVLPRSRLWMNDGSGSFVDAELPQSTSYVGSWITAELVAGDIDGDGDTDLIAGSADQARVCLNDGSASFVDATGRGGAAPGDAGDVAMGDLDGDGDVDALFGDRVEWNDGSGWFERQTAALPVTRSPSEAVSLADLDGDGDLDAVIARDGVDDLWLNDGAGGFVASSWGVPVGAAPTSAIAIADVDGDGDVDVVTGQRGAQNGLWLNTGAATFADGTHQLPQRLDSTRAVALADIDGDGDLDLVVGNDNDEANAIALNDGSGLFVDAPGHHTPTPHNTLAVELGDIDNDGDLDLLLGGGVLRPGFHGILYWSTESPNGGIVSLPEAWLNDGTGRFNSAPMALPDDIVVRALAARDVDGNGSLDIIAGSLTIGTDPDYSATWDGQVTRLWLGNGAGGFTQATELLASRDPQAWGFAACDIDEDGDIDVLSSTTIQRNVTRQLRRLGFPRIGRPLTLEAYGAPGETWVLASAFDASRRPLGAIGTLLLDGSSFMRRGVGVLDAEGRALYETPIPADTALIGTSLYWQALTSGPNRLTNLEIARLSGH